MNIHEIVSAKLIKMVMVNLLINLRRQSKKVKILLMGHFLNVIVPMYYVVFFLQVFYLAFLA